MMYFTAQNSHQIYHENITFESSLDHALIIKRIGLQT